MNFFLLILIFLIFNSYKKTKEYMLRVPSFASYFQNNNK